MTCVPMRKKHVSYERTGVIMKKGVPIRENMCYNEITVVLMKTPVS